METYCSFSHNCIEGVVAPSFGQYDRAIMPTGQEPFSLYVHIPYCISKCPYCDFNSHVVPEIPEANYTAALIHELNHYTRIDHWRGRSVQTIFFGGGTLSTFQLSSIGRIHESAAAF